MGLGERISKLFGKAPAVDSNLATDQARQRRMHGQEVSQTAEEQGGMRQRMEADIDAQRAKRAEQANPDA